MAKKHLYRAEFSVGDKVKRQTENTFCTHAWAVYHETKLIKYGFSSSPELAWKAAKNFIPIDIEAAYKRKRNAYDRQAILDWLKEHHDGS